ncbi:MAG: hypothetical protein HGA75_07270, partial [Thiobacillus sp.]|nr:hypothetical protein [Thiobacillus sp.]
MITRPLLLAVFATFAVAGCGTTEPRYQNIAESYVGPTGADGPAGPAGVQGPTGATGPTG